MDTPVVIEQVYDSPIEKVWVALTDENKLREWYFPQITKFEPVGGFEFEFTDDGSEFKKDWRVTQVWQAFHTTLTLQDTGLKRAGNESSDLALKNILKNL